MPLVLLPFTSTLWFPRFRMRAQVRVTPSPRRSPPAQYPGVRQAYPQGVHALGFDDEFFSLRRVNEGFLSVVSLTSTGSGIPRCFNLQRSPPRLLTAAAWSGLEPAPESRLRRVHLHLSRSFCTVGQVILLMPSFLCTAAHRNPGNAKKLEFAMHSVLKFYYREAA